jgi:arylsulfatase
MKIALIEGAMKRLNCHGVVALAAAWLGLISSPPSFAQQPTAPTKPNILFILADNVGYGDMGVYGGGELRGAPTPRIDRLAAYA